MGARSKLAFNDCPNGASPDRGVHFELIDLRDTQLHTPLTGPMYLHDVQKYRFTAMHS